MQGVELGVIVISTIMALAFVRLALSIIVSVTWYAVRPRVGAGDRRQRRLVDRANVFPNRGRCEPSIPPARRERSIGRTRNLARFVRR